MKKSVWIYVAIVVVGLLVFGGLKLSGVDLSKGVSFSVGGASADNGSASYSGKELSLTVDSAQSWVLNQSNECVTLGEGMPAVKDGKATYAFTASADGDCTLTLTGEDGKTLTADFTVEGSAIKHVRLK